MKRFLSPFLWAVLAAAGLSGCMLVTDKHGHTRLVLFHPEPVGVAVSRVDCHHHDGCGHYWYNDRWYAHHGHRHGHGCGHYYHGGRWVLAGSVNVGHGHVCNHHCDHYHHNGHWYGVRHHRHGHGCGHVLRGGVWVGIGF
jgi:hypothetical protein